MQFNDLDDYMRITLWMRECGNTNALANEIQFRTPVMLFPGRLGWEVARPGDWVARISDDYFTVFGGNGRTP